MAFLLALTLVMQAPSAAVTTLAHSTGSFIDKPRQVAVRTAAEWAALWKEHAGEAPAPKVDLSKSTVVAVFLGDRMTAGYAVNIIGTRRDGAGLVVEWAERKPAADRMTAQVITSPAHIASIPAFAGEIRFEQVEK
jgi:hypothetical protein